MEQGYLIDSNTAIDYLDDKLPEKTARLIDGTVANISVVTRMEILAWKKATLGQLLVLEQFVGASVVYGLDEPVILKAIEVRKNHGIKLPDAIIAATAIVYGLTLLTRNIADFKKIDGLQMLNPYAA